CVDPSEVDPSEEDPSEVDPSEKHIFPNNNSLVECVSDAFESCNQENLRKEMDQLVLHDEETADRERELQCLAKVFGPLELCDLLPHFRLQT
uniref:Uncharacterized protein n=1 Tax=Oncorhynchus mykiss TaxID=8022 RepID=A0A8C7V404_ONCMY